MEFDKKPPSTPRHSLMVKEEHLKLLKTLEELCESIQAFIDHHAEHAIYRAPIIDYHHPDDYRQKEIVGLTKFLSNAKAERDYVVGVSIHFIPIVTLSYQLRWRTRGLGVSALRLHTPLTTSSTTWLTSRSVRSYNRPFCRLKFPQIARTC